jgi:ectoine hydroxylase-related dioxygenase (phytanoyl-CoA dioxygenase family)
MSPELSIYQEELATRGYTIVPDVLSTAEITELREIVDALYRLHDPGIDFEGLNIADGRPDGRPPQSDAFAREYNFATCLLTKHSAIWPVVSREPIMSLIRSIVGPGCVLSSLNSLEPLPGRGHQPLHRDEGPAGPEGYVTANSIWVLDAMDAGNGATRLIPGTHTTAELSDDARWQCRGDECSCTARRVDQSRRPAQTCHSRVFHQARSQAPDGLSLLQLTGFDRKTTDLVPRLA